MSITRAGEHRTAARRYRRLAARRPWPLRPWYLYLASVQDDFASREVSYAYGRPRPSIAVSVPVHENRPVEVREVRDDA